MNTKHRVVISTPFGVPLASPNYFQGDYVRAENDVGSLSLVLPGDIPEEFLVWHGRIEIYRSLNGDSEVLVEETIWLITKITRRVSGVERYWDIEAEDANTILRGRTVDYNQGNAYTLKLGAADDLAKAIMRENFGSLATDTTRDISAYLSIDADTGSAPTVRKAFENRVVLDVLKELAEASLSLGTYLCCDVIYRAGLFVFKTYTGYRGNDHRFPSGASGPLVVGPDFGNMTEVTVTKDYSDSWNRAIVSGDSTSGVFAKARVNNTEFQGLSPIGLKEMYASSQNQVADSTLLTSEANTLLGEGRPKILVSGKLVPTPSFVYGLHWGWGDYITAQIDGVSYDMRVERVQVPIGSEPMSDQSVEVILRSE